MGGGKTAAPNESDADEVGHGDGDSVAGVVGDEPEGSGEGAALCEVAGAAGAPRPYAGRSTRMRKPLSALFPIAAQ